MADLRYALTTGSPAGYDGIYTDLQLWWDTECRGYDFVTNGNRKILECFNDWPGGYDQSVDLNFQTDGGYNADADNYPLMRSESGSVHNGTPNSGFTVFLNGNARRWRFFGNYSRLEYIEIKGNNSAVGLDIDNAINTVVRGIIFQGGSNESYLSNLQSTSLLDSCIFYCRGVNVKRGLRSDVGQNNGRVRNCTFIGPFVEKAVEGFGATVDVVNCVAIDTAQDAFAGCTGDYNASDDGTAPGANSIQDASAADFVDVANDDGHIDESSKLYRTGQNIYDGTGEQTDIDGEQWPAAGAWDIGADYVSGAPVVTGNAIMFGTNF